MKNLNNSKKAKNIKKTTPAPPPSRVLGNMGRQMSANGGVRRDDRAADAKKKPPLSQKSKPAVKKRPPERSSAAVRSGNAEPPKKPLKKPAAPSKPVDKRARKAADKAAQSKQSAAVKKNKYHGGNYVLYYIFAAVIVVLVLIVLANTVLFRCKEITVVGNARYSAEEIIADSGLSYKMNLLHVNRNEASEKVISSLAYVDSAKVRCIFPSTIEISVTEAEKRFSIQEGTFTAAVSHAGKIVEQGYFPDLPLVIGMEPKSIETGAWLKSKIEAKNGIPDEILDAAESAMMNNITKIDVTDRFSLEMELDNGRIIISLGTASDLENKVKIAKEFVDTEVSETESVIIIVSNPTRVTLRPNVPEEDPFETSEPETSDPETSEPESASKPLEQ